MRIAGTSAKAALHLSPLFRMALLKGSLPSVLLHIRRGAPVNGQDDKGLTPLMLAAASGRREICLLLLEEGADASITSASNRTASDIALSAGYGQLATLLNAVSDPIAVAVEKQARNDSSTGNDAWTGGGWEAEDLFEAAVASPGVVSSLRETQNAISAAKLTNLDPDWQDILIELPDVTPALSKAFIAQVLRLIEGALHDPLVGAPAIHRAVRRLPGLQSLLEDLGIGSKVTTFETILFGDSEPLATFDDREIMGELSEALDALRLSKPASELYQLELGRFPAMDRDAEQSMFRALRDAKRQVVSILLAALPLVGGVLSESEAADDGDELTSPPDEVTTGDLDADAGDQPEGGLAGALRAARDSDRDKNLDDLVDLDLDLNVVASFRRALALRTDAADNGERLDAATARYLKIRNRVAEANLPFVTRYAARYLRPGVLLEDLLQDGSIGLLRAVERFDASRGYRFMTFAIWWIRQACSRTTEGHARTIHIPVHLLDQVNRVSPARSRLLDRFGRQPSIEELARELGVPPARAQLLDQIRHRPMSIGNPAIAPLIQRLSATDDCTSFDAAAAGEGGRIISRILETLPPRQERVLRSRFGLAGAEEETLEEIGAKMSVTRERIRQIESKALTALSKPGTPRCRKLRTLL